jgi:hypothetical protein
VTAAAADVVIDEVFETIAVARNRAAVGRDEAQRISSFLHDAKRALV